MTTTIAAPGETQFRETLVAQDRAAAESPDRIEDAGTRAAFEAAMQLEPSGAMSADALEWLKQDEAKHAAAEKAAEPDEKPAEEAEEAKTDEEPAEEKAPTVEVTETPEYKALAAEKLELETQLHAQDERNEVIWAQANWAVSKADELLEQLAEAKGWDQDKIDLYRLRAAQELEKAIKEAPEVGAAKKAREEGKAKAEAEAKAKAEAAKAERTKAVKQNLEVAMAEVPGVPAAEWLKKFFNPQTGIFDTKAAKAAKKAAPAPKPKPVAAKPAPQRTRELPSDLHPKTIEALAEYGLLDQFLD